MKKRAAYLLIICNVLILFSCSEKQNSFTEKGVSIELAELREKQLTDIKYFVFINIPDSINEKIEGKVTIDFNFIDIDKIPLIIDFQNNKDEIINLKLNQEKINYRFINDHIIIPSRKLNDGKNTIEIDFIATDRALNRNKEYLYTLFVPDRASTAFPCFDQPSLKATFKLELKTPVHWTAVSNSELKEMQQQSEFCLYSYNESEPISTYLFSFAAGIFNSVSETFNGRTITMYHRESDSMKVSRNQKQIFALHFSSLEWLEKYTSIPYPFQKFDFVVIPSFQYSGMEHPGAILYRDNKLFLDESAGIRDELSRANLIAHETAHMWFGDLVTMKWFGQVWLKEVFANFIADKIVNPLFPDVNHHLNFLISHYPEAYSVDRTKGSNPIDQYLGNMNNAGTLYGSIIYHKAPIVMQQLEKIIGESILKSGLQDYLSTYKFGNATWDDLIKILETKTDYNLKEWSNNWVKKTGMPMLQVNKSYNTKNILSSIVIEQSDPSELEKKWPQHIEVMVFTDGKADFYNVMVEDTFSVIPLSQRTNEPSFILNNSNGLGYGYFELDEISKKYLLSNLSTIKDPIIRCSIYITFWENMLNKNILPDELLYSYLNALKTESDEQNINLLLNYISSIFWKFSNQQKRNELTLLLEDMLWNKIQNATSPKLKYTILRSYINTCNSSVSLEKIYQIWNKKLTLPGITLSENDYIELSYEIVLRSGNNGDSILTEQLKNITDDERKAKMRFIIPALSTIKDIRDSFFESLKLEKNREKETWVITALYYLHHPLRSEGSIEYIKPSLDLLQEIQSTGDIFFPKQWLDATFSGHYSIDAVIAVNVFLNENPDYPENLKNKIIQSSDLLFRASQIIDQ